MPSRQVWTDKAGEPISQLVAANCQQNMGSFSPNPRRLLKTAKNQNYTSCYYYFYVWIRIFISSFAREAQQKSQKRSNSTWYNVRSRVLWGSWNLGSMYIYMKLWTLCSGVLVTLKYKVQLQVSLKLQEALSIWAKSEMKTRRRRVMQEEE